MTYQRFTSVIVRPLLAVSMLVTAILFPLVLKQSESARAQALINPGQLQTFSDWAVNELSRRLTNIENENLDRRVGILESDMEELKWLSRSVIVVVVGQFFVTLTAIRRRGASE